MTNDDEVYIPSLSSILLVVVQPNLPMEALVTLAPNDANSVTILNLSYFDVSYNLQSG